MRFKEFRIVKEANSTFDAINQVSNLANSFLDPLGSIGGGDGAKEPSGITVPGDKSSKTNIGPGAKGTINSADVSSYLKSKMDDNHRLGILANIQGESGFSPGIVGDNNTSGGLFQHHADRFNKMVNYVGNDWATDWKNQIDFALSEPAGKEYLSTRFRTPEEATEWWVRKFERPKYATSDTNKRIGSLKNFA